MHGKRSHHFGDDCYVTSDWQASVDRRKKCTVCRSFNRQLGMAAYERLCRGRYGFTEHSGATELPNAVSLLSRLKRAAATLSASLAFGDPPSPGVKVTALGFKAEIDATVWLIVSAERTMDASGLKTRIAMDVAYCTTIAQ